uniref:BLE2 protein n=1 Tax=Kalanchoe fedtschenkoi TaxID=63787 RepID=A0A7N1A3P1_KALFE
MNQEAGDSMNNNAAAVAVASNNAPEKKLTHFALRLALLEKTATVFGTLGFIWATVVLLGGFAITLDTTDFWFITVILVIEGARIFSRSHELEFQHQATWLSSDGSASRSHDEESQIPPGQSSVGINFAFLTPNISKILYWLQLFSATTCVALSLTKLAKHDFGQIQKGDTDKRNRKAALYIFYSLALAEASLFLLERAYWVWNVDFLKLLEKVNDEYGLGAAGMVSITRFFYDAYSRSVNGSCLDSLKMDMLSFAGELLISTSPDEQHIGATLLRQLTTKEEFSTATLRKIGVDVHIIERLIEMLNWRYPNEKEIRISAAEILAEVASRKQNSLRMAEIPGAVESVASLLRTTRSSYTGAGDEICQRGAMSNQETIDMQLFNVLGLKILNELSRDHDNCGKIGNTRGLLPKIIDFTYTTADMFTYEGHITTVRQSLELVNTLASTTGVTGSNLRKEISEIVFTISYIRDILKNGEKHPKLQLLGIEVLTKLGLEDDATEKIGGTGGVLKELLNIFLRETATEEQERLRDAAGDAMAMLTLESKSNCHRVLLLQAMDKLVKAVESEALCTNTARILMNLCAYTEDPSFDHMLHKVVAIVPTVLKAVMEAGDKQQEMMTGLAFNVFHYKVCSLDEFSGMLREEKPAASVLARALVQTLKKQPAPSIRVPRMRRFAIELAIWMMRDCGEENVDTFRRLFRQLEMKTELAGVMETTSDFENFHLFSGTVGVSRYAQSLHSLARTASNLLDYN